ncbi:uncharacterized protein LOC144003264 isoform X1 [Festucalex cinctus]
MRHAEEKVNGKMKQNKQQKNNRIKRRKRHSVFKVSQQYLPDNIKKNGLMVDCGATSHIINEEDKFTTFDETFNPAKHYMELADGKRQNNVALKRGDAKVVLQEKKGCLDVTLKKALYIPTYPQSIISVKAAMMDGAKVTFEEGQNELITKDGTVFNIEEHERLYYMRTEKRNTGERPLEGATSRIGSRLNRINAYEEEPSTCDNTKTIPDEAQASISDPRVNLPENQREKTHGATAGGERGPERQISAIEDISDAEVHQTVPSLTAGQARISVIRRNTSCDHEPRRGRRRRRRSRSSDSSAERGRRPSPSVINGRDSTRRWGRRRRSRSSDRGIERGRRPSPSVINGRSRRRSRSSDNGNERGRQHRRADDSDASSGVTRRRRSFSPAFYERANDSDIYRGVSRRRRRFSPAFYDDNGRVRRWGVYGAKTKLKRIICDLLEYV